ncbi:MAG: lytic transglycosylase domain-containing protein [Pseudomonadota bacterium]
MGKVGLAIATVALALASPASADRIDQWQHLIAEAAVEFDIPSDWIERVMRAESGGRTHLNGRLIISHAGAMGLMQLMPGTWAALRKQLGLGHDPHNPRDNIRAGTAYLRAMYDRFGYPGLFAAYNAGPGRHAQYLRGERALPAETIAYLAQVSGSSMPPETSPLDTASSENAIFFALEGRNRSSLKEGSQSSQSTLFVPLREQTREED